ncbi:hypothetical protein [Proteiniborus sp.]|uniref:hypothetical protein n=1 Tax=Proteiniborus sp. TaxID=2079015 RepID=UPI003330FA5F
MSIKEKTNRTVQRILNSLRRKRVYNTYNYSGNENFYKKQLKKIVFCIIVVLAVLLIKKINIKFTNNVIRIVDESINYSFDIKGDTKKVFDFVKNKVKIPDKVIETFSIDVSK